MPSGTRPVRVWSDRPRPLTVDGGRSAVVVAESRGGVVGSATEVRRDFGKVS